MSNLISRQAAIDAIDEYDFDFPNYMERFVTELRDAMKADIKHDIEALPSAQPDGRYINADELIKRLKQSGQDDAARIALKMAGHERKKILPSVQPDKDLIHLQKEQAYMQGWEDGQKALREEMWEYEREGYDQQTGCD